MRVRVRVRGFGAAHGHAENDDERAAGRCRRRVCSGDFGGRELESKYQEDLEHWKPGADGLCVL